MERAGKTIAKLRNMPGISTEELALQAWAAALGPRLAARAKATKLVRDKLVVQVEDYVWQGHLHQLRGAILGKLSEILGGGIVNEVEYRIVKPSEDLVRRPPQKAQTIDSGGDADGITDPIFLVLYAGSKRKAGA